ncbi:PKD domain-containing protein [Algibacter aquimarinus]|uniref:PKD domain-containing protein n=1 Tax=Algibacter aquimarinus TaxID=1136748 RepID=A0ABP9H3K5_9FLAO|nr:PKD domain-containing protein [uncultured Polaribacter sp.]
MRLLFCFVWILVFGFGLLKSYAQSSRDTIYPIFQFPQNKIPRIDGDFSDWNLVPSTYAIGLDQMKESINGIGFNLDAKDLDITVKVGWVKDLNRLYFYLEVFDDFWEFEQLDIRQDIFELVVDADVSGGNFIKKWNANKRNIPIEELHFRGHGAHAQNYHVFIPAVNKDWAMVWGNTPWIKNFPYANSAYKHNLEQGKSGKLQLEFWITPFDYAAIEGINRSAVSTLKENEIIAMSWSVLDYDDDNKERKDFINLAHNIKMIHDGDYMNAFRLMPLIKPLQPKLQANWSFVEVDRDRRIFAFKDESLGIIEKWTWDFGDGTTSKEQSPVHQYKTADHWTVVLTVENKDGKSIHSKVWDVVTK